MTLYRIDPLCDPRWAKRLHTQPRAAQKIARLPRKICFAIHQDLTVRILVGYSLLVLAK